ncbi:DUF2975 domain-containing protein [Bacteroides sp. OttesenSCG-928-J23]|nr:DUF2975 domain-containing protein [Bacteroides sp. OttesenSCG-928-N06]MDL2247494.1 DUF2975 domain-containing protein [Bacteroides sp. OttesenSCG-928-J23]MDL2304502.1 DUF2975 domain-containing protein [Bacteroides sp. OttesenSCG-928-D19]
MRKRLNILCILIFVAIASSIVSYFHYESYDFVSGFQEGQKKANDLYTSDIQDENIFLTMEPTTLNHYPDSIYNEATGRYLPMQYREIVVKLEKATIKGWALAVSVFLALVVLASSIVQIVTFLRLIYVINKQVIFEWSNVVKLRIIGVAMLVAFAAYALFSFLVFNMSMDEINIPGYILKNKDVWNFTLLISGLCVLLMGEIFAMGLRLREEQDLTI